MKHEMESMKLGFGKRAYGCSCGWKGRTWVRYASKGNGAPTSAVLEAVTHDKTHEGVTHDS